MKAIIFDLDNTLIDWKDEFIFALNNVLKELGLSFSKEKVDEINAAIDDSENHYEKLTKKDFLEFVNRMCKIALPMEFVDKLIEAQKECSYQDEEVRDTLEYLSKKYKIYLITNWFTATQEGRLAKAGILKYFTKVYGADINYYKPSPKAFEVILKMYDAQDCVYVGDSLEKDILPAIDVGMNVIWKTDKQDSKYQTIKLIKELKNIL